MKLLIIASAKGGSGKTAAAVAIAEALRRQNIAAGIIDLSPSPTAHWLVRDSRVFIAAGRGASSPTAARAVLKPHADRAQVAIIDTGSLDDPALDPWIPLSHAVLLVSRIDALSIAAFPSLHRGIDRIKSMNPAMQFPGLLPTMMDAQSERLLASISRHFPQWFFRESIPWSADEASAHQASCFEDAPPAGGSPLAENWDRVTARLMPVLGLESQKPVEVAPAAPSAKGLLTSLWRKAAESIGARVRVLTN